MKGAAALCILAMCGAWLAWPHAEPRRAPRATQTAVGAPIAARATASESSMPWLAPVAATRQGEAPAWVSMAEARVHGDERAPPIQAQRAPDPGPTAAQLADPAAYRAYEKDQHARTLAAFAVAAETQVRSLRADVDRARLAGIAPGEIAKVEKKIQRLEKLRRGIVEHGEVGPDDQD